jgi:sugar transferase (PEP-CTERM system associated)
MISMIAMGLHSRRLRDRGAGLVLRVSLSVGAGGVLAAILTAPLPEYRLSFAELIASMIVAWLLLVVIRLAAQRLIDEDRFKRRVLVYGAGSIAARILQLRRRADQRGFRLLGFVPAASEELAVPAERVLTLSGSLSEYVTSNEIDEVVVAMDDRRRQCPLMELLACRLAGIEVSELVAFLERETGKVYLDVMNPSWMIFGGGFRRDTLRRFSERAFDLAASLVLLSLTFPIMALTALAIKMEEGLKAPVLYGQTRVGYGGRVFRVLKFRSMRVDAEGDGRARWAQVNDQRVTRVGSFIRKVRIDELPQLLNVLRGQMSFVGPRPERPEFVKKLGETVPYYDERHSVKPGITGWAQLCYPYGASEQDAVEKLQYDLYYVKNHSLLFDILILLQTVEVILLGKGAR